MLTLRKYQVGKHIIGYGEKPFIVAEAGGNANSSLTLALELVEKAADAGAHSIKFQTYKAQTLVTKHAPKYWVDTMKDWEEGKTPVGNQIEEFSQLDGLSFNDYQLIKKRCDERGIVFFSTPFDLEAVDMLDALGVEIYKIASADITYKELLEKVAKKGRPIVLSTGASTMEEVKQAVNTIKETGNDQIILLQCTLHYPCHYNEAHIAGMKTLMNEFPELLIGLSDHSLGILVPLVAAANGAVMIEKHYTIDKSLGTSTDHFISVDPAELKSMVEQTSLIPEIMGSAQKLPDPSESLSRAYARRSVTTVKQVKKGELITRENTLCRRPGTGISPMEHELVIGKTALIDIDPEQALTWEMITQN